MRNNRVNFPHNGPLEYPEESIGRLMKSDYVAIRPEVTVTDALAHVRQHGTECVTLDTI